MKRTSEQKAALRAERQKQKRQRNRARMILAAHIVCDALFAAALTARILLKKTVGAADFMQVIKDDYLRADALMQWYWRCGTLCWVFGIAALAALIGWKIYRRRCRKR